MAGGSKMVCISARLTRYRMAGLVACALVSLISSQLMACPFCAPQVTFSEQIENSTGALAAQWVQAVLPDETKGDSGSTTFKTQAVLRGGKLKANVDTEVTLPYYMAGEPGDLYFVTAHQTGDDTFEWDRAERISPVLVKYIQGRPGNDAPVQERLRYFLTHLEHPEETIAIDAYSEFAGVRYEDVAMIAKELPREKLLDWVTDVDPDTAPVARRAFYGMLLGLCGTKDDAEILEQILFHDDTLIIGRDGIASGYLLIAGEAGLDRLDPLLTPAPDDEFGSGPFVVASSVRFMWTFGDGRISKERLIRSMRKLLENPRMAEMAITDLARWDDFSLVDSLVKYYDREGYNHREMQTTIIRYYLTIRDLNPADRPVAEQQAIAKAGIIAANLKAHDPELFERAERFLRPASVNSGLAEEPRTATETENSVPSLK